MVMWCTLCPSVRRNRFSLQQQGHINTVDAANDASKNTYSKYEQSVYAHQGEQLTLLSLPCASVRLQENTQLVRDNRELARRLEEHEGRRGTDE